ncbi:MAG: phenylacetate-CoA oxygenase, PaaJ subunit [Bacteroidetes bacterium]|nr:phenylacetate-CoA oxygenase, PaaJ subunit [Bacteroidota bacterium]
MNASESIPARQVFVSDREAEIWKALGEVADPEIPVLSLVELGVIRSVMLEGSGVEVEMTPTFTGCPALERMKEDVELKLKSKGFDPVVIRVNHSAPWSTDNLDEATKEKLRVFGIAPPPKTMESLAVTLELPVVCPFCSSAGTHLESPFGATLCKQIYYCDSCMQSFERFKPL